MGVLGAAGMGSDTDAAKRLGVSGNLGPPPSHWWVFSDPSERYCSISSSTPYSDLSIGNIAYKLHNTRTIQSISPQNLPCEYTVIKALSDLEIFLVLSSKSSRYS